MKKLFFIALIAAFIAACAGKTNSSDNVAQATAVANAPFEAPSVPRLIKQL
jgi:PBP1b-binding outer membrane lipoprotein LpoB